MKASSIALAVRVIICHHKNDILCKNVRPNPPLKLSEMPNTPKYQYPRLTRAGTKFASGQTVFLENRQFHVPLLYQSQRRENQIDCHPSHIEVLHLVDHYSRRNGVFRVCRAPGLRPGSVQLLYIRSRNSCLFIPHYRSDPGGQGPYFGF